MQIDQLGAYIGEGTDNLVYSVSWNSNLVVKLAKSTNQNLLKQAYVLSTLESTELFPKVHSTGNIQIGIHPHTHLPLYTSILIMDKLGISLEEFMTLRLGNITVGMVKKIGVQLVNKVRVMHSYDIVHNDIKPGNILFGMKEKRNKIFLVDFGLSDRLHSLEHQSNKSIFKGNLKFSSLRKLKGFKGHKLDDIESLIYVLLWMLLGGKEVSQLINCDNQSDETCLDKSKMSFHECLLKKMQQKLSFLQNAQRLLKSRISGEKLDLGIKLCRILQICTRQQCQQRPEFFYSSMQDLLAMDSD